LVAENKNIGGFRSAKVAALNEEGDPVLFC
jgi:hypothetical protein